MAKRKPTNKLIFSKKPSLKKSPVLAEAERKLKEKKAAERTAAKAEKKPVIKKASVKKAPVKKSTAKKGAANKGAKDPMWKHLAAALKKGKD